MSSQKWDQFNCLHPNVVGALKSANFSSPTLIQSELYNNYKYYSDFLVASQTGSGKTLAFAAPIVSDLLSFSQKAQLPQKILCLVLTPTRELAQQIETMINMIIQDTPIRQAMIVGGLSAQKQIRVLKKKMPHIIIGTPGRLHELLNDQYIQFSSLKYIVMDQADRMVQLGHYVELDEILNKIFTPKLKQYFEDDFHKIESSLKKKQQKNEEFYIKQNGKKVKLSFNMHSFEADKLFEVPADMFSVYNPAKQEKQKKKKKKVQPTMQMIQEKDQIQENVEKAENPAKNEEWQRIKRKIFFISATLTREFKGTKYFTKKNSNKKEEKQKEDDDGYSPKLKALLSRINFNSKPKVIDQSSELFLPANLRQSYAFSSGQLEKIAIMLCYIKEQQRDSKIIIFTNTIKASKRIQFFVSQAGQKSVLLNSHMLQKQRLLKLEKFKKSKINILISTDVAARGLDFFITNVIQYGVPVNGDTYVHRVGRTARANRQGQALILLSQKQATKWEQISNIVGGQRKIHRYNPQQLMMNEMQEKVERYEWIRIHEQKIQNKKIQTLNKMEAEQLGVEAEQQKLKKKVDKDEEEVYAQKMKRKLEKVREMNKQENVKNSEIGDGKKWKKNKLVLSLDEIKKFL